MAMTRLFQGDNGYLYIPYQYMTDPALVYDAFVVKKFSKIELGDDHWKISAPEPSAFGASAASDNEGNDWDFEEADNGYNQTSDGFGASADNSGGNEWSFEGEDDDTE